MKHEVKIVRLGNIEKHPNADTLGLTEIDGYTVVVRLTDWSPGDLGVYIEPDYVVPDAPWNAFLQGKFRIKVKKLRGVYSQGLLVKLSDVGLEGDEGQDVMEALGIIRYEPPEPGDPRTPGKSRSRDPGEPPHPSLANIRKYDLESWQKYKSVFENHEVVQVTEKLHGENARYAWRDGRMWVGSRNRWVSQEEGGNHWATLRDNPWIEDWCKEHDNLVLFGESYGGMKGMSYGIEPGRRGFRAFDIYDTNVGEFLSIFEFYKALRVNEHDDYLGSSRTAPLLFIGPLDEFNVTEAAEGQSTLYPHIREGVVIKPLFEQYDRRVGRIALKCVGNGYLEKSND